MRMLVSVEFADAGTKTGTHRALVVDGCSDATAAGDIGISLEEAKTHGHTESAGPMMAAVIAMRRPISSICSIVTRSRSS